MRMLMQVVILLVSSGSLYGQDVTTPTSEPESFRITTADNGPARRLTSTEPGAPQVSTHYLPTNPEQATTMGEHMKITREDTREHRKIVTAITIRRDGVLEEYHRVIYDWGGVYYFKNSTTSISETLFMQWTGLQSWP